MIKLSIPFTKGHELLLDYAARSSWRYLTCKYIDDKPFGDFIMENV